MKKSKIIGIIFLLSTGFLNAQKVSVGSSLDANASFLKYKNNPELQVFSWGFGFNAAIPIDYRISPLVGIEVHPGYAYYTPDYKTEAVEENYRFSYISLPFYAKINPTQQVSFFFGPDFSYMIRAQMLKGGEKSSVYDFYNNHFYFGLSGGISFNFSEKFRLQGLYTYGFSSLIDEFSVVDEDGNPVGEDKLLLRHLEIGIAYFFGNNNKE